VVKKKKREFYLYVILRNEVTKNLGGGSGLPTPRPFATLRVTEWEKERGK
jgi:hypothetical protein